jgi:predicted lipid-binding transport protein (Tim44 family)
MSKWQTVAALLVVGLLALAPSLAAARAGGGYSAGGGSSFMSQGSRGMNTYSGTPMQRSLTPQSVPPAPGAASGYGGYHPFLTGLAGGLFGGWLGSMLFPHWGMGYGMGGLISPIFLWLILIWLGWMAYRAFAGHFSPLATRGGALGFGGLGGMAAGSAMGLGAAAAPAQIAAPLAISGADYQAFETILKGVQTAWSNSDLQGLRRLMTPEMVSYFVEELTSNQSQGVVNRVEQVELVKGDLREAWDEGRMHYASCLLHWRALDYTVRLGAQPGDMSAIVAGDARQPSEAAEVWTFARSPGGQWLLSAIQQV